MANVTIMDLTAETSVDRAADYIEVHDASANASRRMTPNSLLGGMTGTPVGTSDSQTLTNKTLTSPTINTPTLIVNDDSFSIRDNSDTTKIAQFQLSGITTGTTRTYTLPNASSTLADIATAQTFTNKTLTAPTINNPTLAVDTVSEFTAANGVTVDGLLIKDGLLPAGNIQPLNLLAGTGSSWAWQSWTPTFGNLSGGTLNFAKYIQIGKTVHYRWKYTLGGAGVAGTVTFSLPVAAASDVTLIGSAPNGFARFEDAATGHAIGIVDINTNVNTGRVLAQNAGGTYVALSLLSSTIPFTWASGDHIDAGGTYEAA